MLKRTYCEHLLDFNKSRYQKITFIQIMIVLINIAYYQFIVLTNSLNNFVVNSIQFWHWSHLLQLHR